MDGRTSASLKTFEASLSLMRKMRPVAKGHRPLAGVDCMRLALLAPERPSLVVESADGDYVVLVESPPDLERHSPLDFDDSELLTNVDECFGHYGRRDDDVL